MGLTTAGCKHTVSAIDAAEGVAEVWGGGLLQSHIPSSHNVALTTWKCGRPVMTGHRLPKVCVVSIIVVTAIITALPADCIGAISRHVTPLKDGTFIWREHKRNSRLPQFSSNKYCLLSACIMSCFYSG